MSVDEGAVRGDHRHRARGSPSHHGSASFLFTKFINLSGFNSKWDAFLLGLLMTRYTFTGYVSSGHMSEETRNLDLAALRGIVSSIIVSLIAGWILILAITAVTPIALIGLYIAYVLPTVLRRAQGANFKEGRWSLGIWSPLVGRAGIIWVACIAVLFMLPELSLINRDTFNHSPIAVGVVLIFARGYWLLSARKRFTGPKVRGIRDELKAIEAELSRTRHRSGVSL